MLTEARSDVDRKEKFYQERRQENLDNHRGMGSAAPVTETRTHLGKSGNRIHYRRLAGYPHVLDINHHPPVRTVRSWKR